MATFFNQATLSYNGNVVNSNITSGEILEVLSITKTAVSDRYRAGGNVTYVISVVNTGTTPYTGLTLTDNLGAYPFGTETLTPLTYVDGSIRYFVNGTPQPAPTVTAGPPLAITGISVPAGGNVTLVYEADVNGFAPLGEEDSIVNQAVLSGGGITSITATETVTPNGAPLLSISKSVSPTVVAENGQITYTFIIQNQGNTPAVATDNVIITDTFDPILSDLTVTVNGVPIAENAGYTYNEATGQFATQLGVITVDAATYVQDAATGTVIITPGVTVVTVTGTV
ncbi:MAG: DUF11 domain-containing protein [Clostridia bacterium]|nr:DUF11 domain-containing protein [Clostridia bacterium]